MLKQHQQRSQHTCLSKNECKKVRNCTTNAHDGTNTSPKSNYVFVWLAFGNVS